MVNNVCYMQLAICIAAATPHVTVFMLAMALQALRVSDPTLSERRLGIICEYFSTHTYVGQQQIFKSEIDKQKLLNWKCEMFKLVIDMSP